MIESLKLEALFCFGLWFGFNHIILINETISNDHSKARPQAATEIIFSVNLTLKKPSIF